ncbi:hypothetical protein D3C74_392280 [compost metagenome]
MNESENVVFITVADWITRSHSIKSNFQVLLCRKMAVQTDHFSPGDHDLSGHSISKFKNIVYQCHFGIVDEPALIALLHDNTDLFLGVRCCQLRSR